MRIASASRCIVVEEVLKEVGRSVIAVGRNHMESVANAKVLYTWRRAVVLVHDILNFDVLDHAPCG